MGRDKATLTVAGSPEPLARRTARLLAEATGPALEVGPGHTDLPVVGEDVPGSGPLAALAAGVHRLRALGWDGPAVVLATDLPFLTLGLVRWLAEHPSSRSVVPVAQGAPQTLCARYAPDDLERAVALAERGRRSMRDLLEGGDVLLAGPELWEAAAGDPGALTDIDTPSDLARLRGRPS